MPWPVSELDSLDECAVVGDGKLCFRILEAYLKQQVLFNDGEMSIELNFDKRFPVYLYPENENNDKALSVVHYEQGLYVSGKINYQGKDRAIECLGHRDHTWGHRDESGLTGWNWIAFQTETSTWNFCLVSRQESAPTMSGFISSEDKVQIIKNIETLELEHNGEGEPLHAKYKVLTEDGSAFHVSAKRYRYIPIPLHATAFVHENISEFAVEETGESGLGIDEHMVGKLK